MDQMTATRYRGTDKFGIVTTQIILDIAYTGNFMIKTF
jgi:hypothetical protein